MENNNPILYKFSGAGNDFVIIDGRNKDVSRFRAADVIGALCREYRTDGLMILDEGPSGADFSMEFFNPDGSGGMMCGNGGRCIVAFADMMGIRPSEGISYRFIAPDGLHIATILEKNPGKWTVRLKMIDVNGVSQMMGGWFLNTGTRHFVRFVEEDVDRLDVDRLGRELRHHSAFAPEGTNVNFVQVAAEGLRIRTFEKGVEGETLACGTGITASAIAAYKEGIKGEEMSPGRLSYALQCHRGDWLQVEFTPDGDFFSDVFLTGPAETVAI